MILVFIFVLIYIGSMVAYAHTMIERYIDPNPISIFILLCPIINLIYTIYRSKGSWKSWFKNL